jgi:hypothetical protein
MRSVKLVTSRPATRLLMAVSTLVPTLRLVPS